MRHGNIPAASPQKTAEAILEGTVARKKDIYYPLLKPIVIASNFPIISDIFDYFIRFQMERSVFD